jgi:hypothetical protein
MSTRNPREGSHSARGKVSKRSHHEVGYGKPPRTHQFKAGQSGNPKGRPRGAKNEATILHELLNRKLEVREGGRTRKITVFEAILLRFTEDALKGNTKTATFLFNRYAVAQGGDAQPSDVLGEDDREVLEAFVQRFQAQQRNKKERP